MENKLMGITISDKKLKQFLKIQKRNKKELEKQENILPPNQK